MRRSRRRFWKSENDTDKRSAYQTLYTCLVTLSKLLAPLTPFLAEEMYQNLVVSVDPEAPDSVHLTAFPEADEALVDRELAEAVQVVMRVVSMGRAARSKSRVKVRQPLSEAVVMTRSPGEAAALERLADQVREELNVKAVRSLETWEVTGLLSVRLNGSAVGPKYTDRLPELQRAFAEADRTAIAGRMLAGESAAVGAFELTAEDVEMAPATDGSVAGVLDGGYFVGVSNSITPELRQEGLARELVHSIQNMRRSAGLDISDRIVITHEGADELQALLGEGPLGDYVRGETLAVGAAPGAPRDGDYSETLKIEGWS